VDPTELAEYLRVLKEAGVQRASVPIRADEVLHVALDAGQLVATAAFVDKHGKPVDLDDGMPPLADEAAIDKLYAKNHKPKD